MSHSKHTNSGEYSPPWKRDVTQLLKKLIAIYDIQMFITIFTTAYHQTLSWGWQTQSTSSQSIS